MKKIILLITLLCTVINYSFSEVNEFKKLKLINTHKNEVAPFWTSSEDILIFSSDKAGNYDFYAVYYENNKVQSSPLPLQETDLFYGVAFNSAKDEKSGFISLANKRMFLSVNDPPDGFGGYDILTTTKDRFDDWKKPRFIRGKVLSRQDDKDPCVTNDGKYILFSSNRAGGLGGYDIWYAEYDDFANKWSEAINLRSLNTKGDEKAPFLASDGTTLIFSSNGHDKTKDDFDIYYTDFDGNSTGTVSKFESPINSSADENYAVFSRDGTTCLVSSNRDGSYDIFQANLDPVFYTPLTLKLESFDSETGIAVPVKYEVQPKGFDKITLKGEKSEVIISKNYFAGQRFVDLIVRTENPVYPEHSKHIRLYNGQSQKVINVKFAMSETNPTQAEKISFDAPKNDNNEPKREKVQKTEVSKPDENFDKAYIDGDFQILKDNKLLDTIEAFETSSTAIKPLLYYVFFDENSSVIPRRYKQIPFINGEEFNEEVLSTLPNLDVYYHILNITGYRLEKNPTVNVTLTGTNTNLGSEKSNLDLSLRRANAVKDYLVNTWGIEPTRITVKKRNLPEAASSSRTNEGIAENRRVEIDFSNPALLSPIFKNWKIMKSFPQTANINISSLFHKTRGKWTLTVKYQDDIIDRFSGNNTGEKEILWSINDALSKILEAPDVQPEEQITEENEENEEKKGFFARAVDAVQDVANRFVSFINKSIESIKQDQNKIQQDIANKELDENEKKNYIFFEFAISDEVSGENIIKSKRILLNRNTLSEVINPVRLDNFAFISFDFGKDRLSKEHEEIISYVNNIIEPDSKVSIYGYSDRIGPEKINYDLSQKRAKQVAKSINSENKSLTIIGEKELLYNNDYPEGRMYSRTVIAEIETPINLGGTEK